MESAPGVADRRITEGCDGGCGVSATDGTEGMKIRTATARKPTSGESCRKLDVFKDCSSTPRVHYSR